MQASGPWARFDDLAVGSALRFPGVEQVLVAWDHREVPGVLDEVERRTSAGMWAFGFLAYEAAGGPRPVLATREPVGGLPLAWFGITTAPQVAAPHAPRARRVAAGSWAPEWDRAPPSSGRRGGTVPDRRRGDLPVQPHDPADARRQTATRRALPGPGARPARGLQRLPRHSAGTCRQREPGAVLRAAAASGSCCAR